MTLFQSVSTVFSKYATFNGRASRSEYWYFVLFQFIVSFIICIVFALYKTDTGALQVTGYVVNGLYSLISLLPGLAVTVRRLHDIGKGGGWIFISLVPLIGSLWLFILLILPSQPYANRFNSEE